MVEKIVDSDGREFSVFERKTLKCVDDKTNTNKFWQCALALHINPKKLEQNKPWVVWLFWGRVGTVGQKQEKTFTTEHKAKTYMEQRFRDKISKGYEETSEPALKVRTDESKVGLSKFVDTEWDLF